MQESPADLSNTTIGRYQVLRLVGRGGMGEVYRATDTTLGRDVALKILPAALTRDPERVGRFAREARAASALNHPHLVSIYDIGQEGSIHYIAMELVAGHTLRELIDQRRLELPQALEYLAQIADALGTAHAAGVIHRDLKPDNTMIAADGYAKVLDFGVAKLREDDAAVTGAALTSAGMLLGTVGYMSPEQAQGHASDHRADVFSFGCILYEVIAGRRPFEGAALAEVLVHVILDEPAPLPATTTPALRAIVDRCLAKDPQERYDSMREVASELRRARRELEAGAFEARTAAPPAPRRPVAGIAAAAVLVLAAAGTGWVLTRDEPAPPAAALAVQQLTASGDTTDAAISPDGRYLAWVESSGGMSGLWVRQIDGSKDIEIVPAARVSYWGIAFSPDGRSIYYSTRGVEHPAGRLYAIDMLGGSPRPILDRLESAVTFSQDGTRIAFFRPEFPRPGRDALMITGIDGSNERVLATRAAPETFLAFRSAPSWSPDGSRIAAGVRNVTTGDARLVLFDPATAAEEPTQAALDAAFTAWLPDGTGILFTGREPSVGGVFQRQIWLQPYPRGEPRRVTHDDLDYRTAWTTKDGSRLLAVGELVTGGLWRIPLDGAAPQRIRSERLDGNFGVAALADGRLALSSAGPAGEQRIDILSADGANRQAVADTGTNVWPAMSPDGRTMVFLSSRGGQPGIWRTNADGSGARLLAPLREASWLSVTPDGRFVMLTAPHEGRPAAWTIPLDGGAPTLVAPSFERATPSPDGRLFAGFYKPTLDTPSSLAVMPLMPTQGSGAPRVLGPASPASGFGVIEWTKAGDGIVYSSSERANLFLQPLGGGKSVQLTNLTDFAFTFGDLAPDGKSVIASRGLTRRDAYLFSNFR